MNDDVARVYDRKNRLLAEGRPVAPGRYAIDPPLAVERGKLYVMVVPRFLPRGFYAPMMGELTGVTAPGDLRSGTGRS